MIPESKTCTDCKQAKPLHLFAHNLVGINARSSKCRECLKVYSRKRAGKIRDRKKNLIAVI